MKKIISILLSSFILSCQSSDIIVKSYQSVNISRKENIIDLGNKGPSVNINLNFNRTNPFNIKSISDGFSGISSVSRIELRLSTSPGSSLSDRFDSNGNVVAYINITNPSINNQITVKGLKPNTSYYLSARAYANLRVNDTVQEVNVTSSNGTSNDTSGGGTSGAFGYPSNEEYVYVDSNGVLNVYNDDDDNYSGNGLNPNNNWDILLQLMKSKGSSVSSNNGLVEDGDNTTIISISPFYSIYKSNIIVNRNMPNNQSFSSVAIADNGNYMVVWQGEGAGDSSGIFARLFDKYGNPLTEEFIVNQTTSGNQSQPRIESDGSSFFVVWSGEGPGDLNGIFAKKFNNDGSVSINEGRVNTNTMGNQSSPTISVNSSGNIVIAWQSNETGNNNIKAQRLDSSLNLVGSEFTVNTYTTGEQIKPSVGIEDTGSFVVSWEGEGQGDNDGGGIFFKMFDSNGMSLTEDTRVNESITGIQDQSSLSINKTNGDFAVSFVSNNNNVHLQKYFSNGRKKGNEIVFTNLYTSHNTNVSLNSNGNGMLTWKQDDTTLGSIIEIKFFNMNDNNIVSNKIYYNGNSNSLDYPFTSFNINQAVITWTDSASINSGSDIYMNLIKK